MHNYTEANWSTISSPLASAHDTQTLMIIAALDWYFPACLMQARTDAGPHWKKKKQHFNGWRRHENQQACQNCQGAEVTLKIPRDRCI